MARLEAKGPAPWTAPMWGELRYSGELARLLSADEFRSPRCLGEAQPVMLIPGFMAGDASLSVLRGWLRRRGHEVETSGMVANVGCSEEIVTRLQRRLAQFAARCESQVVLVGQSRGGTLARSLAVRSPSSVSAIVMLGSPVNDPLSVAAPVLRTVRSLAMLGDLGLPRVFSKSCADGDCCEAFREDLLAPLDPGVKAVSVHSRSDAVIDWRATLDPHAERVEVDSSHCGMSVNADVYRVLGQVLDAPAPAPAAEQRRRAA